MADTTPVADARLRLVPIGAYNVAISVVRRSQVDGRTPPDATVHDAITEVYEITEGRGILVIGGTLDDPRPPLRCVIPTAVSRATSAQSLTAQRAVQQAMILSKLGERPLDHRRS